MCQSPHAAYNFRLEAIARLREQGQCPGDCLPGTAAAGLDCVYTPLEEGLSPPSENLHHLIVTSGGNSPFNPTPSQITGAFV